MAIPVRHKPNKNGYCRRCKGECIMTKYIPKYDRVWTWEEIYKHLMQRNPNVKKG